MKSVAEITKAPLTAFGSSDVGRLREVNEDRFYFDTENGFFIVVDGMGGHNAGEKAAEIAFQTIKKRLERLTGDMPERICEAITLANNEIYRQARANEEFSGMACVLTVAAVEDDFVTVGHIGDTRLYLLTDEKITKITRDHSPVGVLEDSCQINELEAMQHPNRNEVFRDVGAQERAPADADFIDIYTFEMPAESSVLMCSDGLSDLLTSGQIFALYQMHKRNLPVLVQTLIGETNKSGGKDNITVLIFSNVAGVSDTIKVFHETQEMHFDEDLKEVIHQNAEQSAAQQSGVFKRLFFSRFAFLIYGSLLTVLLYFVWRYLIEINN